VIGDKNKYINQNKKAFQYPSIIKLHIPNEVLYYSILNKNLTIFFSFSQLTFRGQRL